MAQYTVQSGDTLSKIGQQYGVDYNKITGYKSGNPNLIYPGEVLNIPDATPTMTAESLQNPQQPAQLPEFNPPQVNFTPTLTPQQQTNQGFEDIFKQYLGNQQAPANPADTLRTLEEQQGLGGKQARVNELTGQLNAITAELQANKLGLKAEGLTAAGAGARNIGLEREAAIRALPISAQLSAAQGDLETAQDNVNRYYQIQSDYTKSLFEYQNNLRSAVYEFATKQQQRILDQQQVQDERDYELKISQLKQISSLANQAFNVGNYSLGSQILQKGQDINNIDMDSVYGLIGQLSIPQANISQGPGTGLETQPTGQLSSEALSIINNPSLLSNYTPTVRGRIIAELQSNGYDVGQLGTKPLSDTAISQITQTKSAIENLNQLKYIIKDKENLLGPITGFFGKINPYNAPALNLQADVDRIRQVVGKALEGGVLRKEDEEKYKKILTQITDVPETALYKINQLIADIQGDLDDYTSLQQGAGRSLNITTPLTQAGTAGTVGSGQTSTGNTYTITNE